MFNSQSFSQKEIEFYSNPPLPDQVIIVPDTDENGNYCNKVSFKPSSNEACFAGTHFCRETMSLRAMLNSGVKLKVVSMPSMYSDPLSAQRKISNLEFQIKSRLDSLESEPQDALVVEPSKDE